MRKLVLLLIFLLLAGCSTKMVVRAPGGDLVVAEPSTNRKNVTLVLIQDEKSLNSLFNADQRAALADFSTLVKDSNAFGVVSVDDTTFYRNPDLVPKPTGGDLVLGLTMNSELHSYFFKNLGKTILNLGTLTVSSIVLPYTKECSVGVTVTLIDENGLAKQASAESLGVARWTPWGFESVATHRTKIAVRNDANVSALNQLVAGSKELLLATRK